MIYFAQLPTGSIKIGCSSDVDGRLRGLESYYGAPLTLLATMEGEREREAEIHGRFAHHRIGRTEQFRPGADLMAFIGQPLLVDANPDAAKERTNMALLASRAIRGITSKRIRLQLLEAERDEFRFLAAKERTNMALLARRVIREYIALKRNETPK
jgi:hypothetical protein